MAELSSTGDFVPCINYSILAEEIEKGQAGDSVQRLMAACRNVGFFKIDNHALSKELAGKMDQRSIDFYNSSTSNKKQISMDQESGFYYGWTATENLARTEGASEKLPDAKECVNYFCSSDGKGRSNPDLLRFASQPSDMPKVVEDYTVIMNKMADGLLSALALGYGLPINYFKKFTNNNLSCLRLNHYYQQSQPVKGAIRCGAHTDYGTLTLLRMEGSADASGLQVEMGDRGSNNWVDVVAKPGEIIVNLGDCLQMWTNDDLRSTRHRVINPSDVKKSNFRQTVVFFHNLNADTMVETLKPCLKDGHSSYKPIRFEKHLLGKASASEGADYLASIRQMP